MKLVSIFLVSTSLLVSVGNSFSQRTFYSENSQGNLDSLLHIMIHDLHAEKAQEQKDREAFPSGLMLVICTAIVFTSIVLYNYSKKRSIDQKWRKGIFRSGYKVKRDHLIEVYMRLGARMIQNDRKDAGGKIRYMNTYFRKHFPTSSYNFTTIISDAYRNPIDLRHVANWAHAYLPKKEQKLQVIYFLTGLASLDGDLRSQELNMLTKIGSLLKLSSAEIESIISMYQGYTDSQRASDRSRFSTTKKATAREISTKILGVPLNANLTEIKKAYRSLVKLHHPDRFIHASKEQQELAHQRFIQLQKAYETLEKT